MKISQEDAVFLKCLSKGYCTWWLLNDFPVNGWKWGNIDSLLEKCYHSFLNQKLGALQIGLYISKIMLQFSLNILAL